MRVVFPRDSHEEIEPRMRRRRLYELQCQEDPEGDDVRTDKHQWQRDWEHIGEKMFRDSRILRGQRDGCGETMMEFMNGGVD